MSERDRGKRRTKTASPGTFYSPTTPILEPCIHASPDRPGKIKPAMFQREYDNSQNYAEKTNLSKNHISMSRTPAYFHLAPIRVQ